MAWEELKMLVLGLCCSEVRAEILSQSATLSFGLDGSTSQAFLLKPVVKQTSRGIGLD